MACGYYVLFQRPDGLLQKKSLGQSSRKMPAPWTKAEINRRLRVFRKRHGLKKVIEVTFECGVIRRGPYKRGKRGGPMPPGPKREKRTRKRR